MATITFEQHVVVIKDHAKCEEIKKALSSDTKTFANIKPTSCKPTKEQEEFMKKWFCRSDK